MAATIDVKKKTTSSARSVSRIVQELRKRADKELGEADALRMLALLRELMLRLPHQDLMRADRLQIRTAGLAIAAGGRPKDELRHLQRGLTAFYDLACSLGLADRNPMRSRGRASDLRPTTTLIVCPPGPRLSQLVHGIGSSLGEFEVESDIAKAIDLTRWYPFRNLLCWYPMPEPGIKVLLAELRTANSPCWKTACVVVTSDGRLEGARNLVGHGAGRVFSEGALPPLAPVFARINSAESRKAVRIPIRVKGTGLGGSVLWQSENISGSGLLIRTSVKLEPGHRIVCEFNLPGDDNAIRSTAEVVRDTEDGRDRVDGIGARFISFDQDGKQRLFTYLQSLRNRAAEARA